MDPVKIAAAQAKVREQAAKTNAPEDVVERAVNSVTTNAALVEAGSELEHFHGGLVNVTVHQAPAGPTCRISVTTRLGRGLMTRVLLA